MEVENQNVNDQGSFVPDELAPQCHGATPIHQVSRIGTLIPNRIFIGGLEDKINEGDLEHVFSQYGPVKEVKIVTDRWGVPKGYGFVTFENYGDVQKILHNTNTVSIRERRLIIARAYRKNQNSRHSKRASVANPDSAMPLTMSLRGLQQITSTHCPSSYYNRVSCVVYPTMSNLYQPWARPALPVPPQSHQPVQLQPASQLYQCVPNQCQWNALQQPTSCGPAATPWPSQYLPQTPIPYTEDSKEENQMLPHTHVQPKPNFGHHDSDNESQPTQEATGPPDDPSMDLQHNCSCQCPHPSM